MQIFKDDDGGYRVWLYDTLSGFVVNAQRNPSPSYLILHRATWVTISPTPDREGLLDEPGGAGELGEIRDRGTAHGLRGLCAVVSRSLEPIRVGSGDFRAWAHGSILRCSPFDSDRRVAGAGSGVR